MTNDQQPSAKISRDEAAIKARISGLAAQARGADRAMLDGIVQQARALAALLSGQSNAAANVEAAVQERISQLTNDQATHGGGNNKSSSEKPQELAFRQAIERRYTTEEKAFIQKLTQSEYTIAKIDRETGQVQSDGNGAPVMQKVTRQELVLAFNTIKYHALEDVQKAAVNAESQAMQAAGGEKRDGLPEDKKGKENGQAKSGSAPSHAEEKQQLHKLSDSLRLMEGYHVTEQQKKGKSREEIDDARVAFKTAQTDIVHLHNIYEKIDRTPEELKASVKKGLDGELSEAKKQLRETLQEGVINGSLLGNQDAIERLIQHRPSTERGAISLPARNEPARQNTNFEGAQSLAAALTRSSTLLSH